MLGKILDKLRRKPDRQPKKTGPSVPFTGNIQKDEKILRDIFRDCDDVKFRKLSVPAMGNRKALIVFVEGLVNVNALHRDIIGKMLSSRQRPARDVTELVSAGETERDRCARDTSTKILLGKVAIVVDTIPEAVVVESKEWPMRAIEEPLQERLVRGPREGFTEIIQINAALIRRRLPDPNLKIVMTEAGRRSRTKVAILYIEDVCDLNIVNEVKERINALDIDGIMEPGELAELITERTVTPFPLILSTERPDKVMGGLLQGKVAIITDGSPFAMLAPVTFAEFFQIPEDYYMHPLLALTARLLRLAGLFVATTLVPAFVAVIMHHYEIIPPDIIVFIAQTREGVPFSPIIEAFALEFAVELTREASIRLPGPIGPTLGIVGAIILGQAAVAAHLVSPVLLIMVSMSFTAGSIIPNYEASAVLRWLRFPILLMAGFL